MLVVQKHSTSNFLCTHIILATGSAIREWDRYGSSALVDLRIISSNYPTLLLASQAAKVQPQYSTCVNISHVPAQADGQTNMQDAKLLIFKSSTCFRIASSIWKSGWWILFLFLLTRPERGCVCNLITIHAHLSSSRLITGNLMVRTHSKKLACAFSALLSDSWWIPSNLSPKRIFGNSAENIFCKILHSLSTRMDTFDFFTQTIQHPEVTKDSCYKALYHQRVAGRTCNVWLGWSESVAQETARRQPTKNEADVQRTILAAHCLMEISDFRFFLLGSLPWDA